MERRVTIDLQCDTEGEVLLVCRDVCIDRSGIGDVREDLEEDGRTVLFTKYEIALEIPWNRRTVVRVWSLIPPNIRLELLRQVSSAHEAGVFHYFLEGDWNVDLMREFLEDPQSGRFLLGQYPCTDGIGRSVSRELVDDISCFLERLYAPVNARREFVWYHRRP